jgi:UDP-glucose 4-epimerase
VKYNIKYTIFRVSNIYGEGQNTSKGLGIINTFLEKIISDNAIIVFGNGDIVRNYVYVKDVANILCKSIYSNVDNSIIYNLSSNDSLSINQLIDTIKTKVHENFKVNYIKQRISDNPKILLDNTKLKIEFSDLEFTPLLEGIYNTYLDLKAKEN